MKFDTRPGPEMSTTCLAMAPTEVLLKDVTDLLTCCRCRTAPMLPPVITCCLGHCICTKCRNLRNSCDECAQPLTGRNLPLEKALLTMLQYVPEDLIRLKYDESVEEEDCQEKVEQNNVATEACRMAAEFLAFVITRDCKSQMLTSGRTVSCPFPCNTRITGPGLYRHFGFQHPEVFVDTMCKNRPFSIYIPRELLVQLCDKSPTRCLYFLIVRIGDQEYKKVDNQEDINSIRSAELLSMSHSMSYMLKQRCYLALLSIHRLSDPEVFAVWVTALYDFAPVTYTLRYTSGFNTVSYQGRPVSLFAPAPVDKKGGCLMLTSAMIKRDLNQHQKFVELTLFFHLELPFPRVLPNELSTPSTPVAKLVDL